MAVTNDDLAYGARRFPGKARRRLVDHQNNFQVLSAPSRLLPWLPGFRIGQKS